MNFLITGSTGCLGKNLLPLLLKDSHRTFCLVRKVSPNDFGPACTYIKADLKKDPFQIPNNEKIDVVVHAAAAHLAFEKDFKLNLEMTENILKRSLELGAKQFIFISSVSVYGDLYDGERSESAPKKPDSDYGESKLLCEKAVVAFCQQNGLHYTILRPGLLYGPYDRGGISKLLSFVRLGKVPIFGHGHFKKSMTSVDNIAAAILQVSNQAKAFEQDYIVVDPRTYTILENVEALEKILGKTANKVKMPGFLALALGTWYEALFRLGFKVPLRRFSIEKIMCNNYYSSLKFENDFPGVLKNNYEAVLKKEVDWYLNQKR